jgi:hypothetical protein
MLSILLLAPYQYWHKPSLLAAWNFQGGLLENEFIGEVILKINIV